MSEKGGAQFLAMGKLPGELLARLLAETVVSDPDVIVGPGVGKDAAVVRFGVQLLVAKSDPITFTSQDAAEYLVNVNANDLACMGATARWMLVTALMPAGRTTAENVGALFARLAEHCTAHGIALIGGHTEMTDAVVRPVLVGTMLGLTDASRMIEPGLGQPGDRLLLTRPVAVEGTALLAAEMAAFLEPRIGGELLSKAQSLLRDPGISVVADAGILAASGMCHALHDPTEGGLATGVRELAIASGCGVIIARDAIHVLPETAAIAAVLDLDPLGMLASGSLLAAVRPDRLDEVDQLCAVSGIPAAWIGKLTPIESGMRLREGTVIGPLPVFDTDEVARALASDSRGGPTR